MLCPPRRRDGHESVVRSVAGKPGKQREILSNYDCFPWNPPLSKQGVSAQSPLQLTTKMAERNLPL